MSKFEHNWQQLADIARSETNLIPVVGSGLNIQARQQADSWTQLLHEVADNFQLSEKDLQAVDQQSYGMTAVWERFVTALAEREDRSAGQVENLLRQTVQKSLAEDEATASDYPFYRQFLSLDFKHIISLNFDRSLPLSVSSKKSVIEAGETIEELNENLFRYAQVEDQETRIWYPHGDTQKYRTIRLGVRDYGIYLDDLQEAFNLMKMWEREDGEDFDPSTDPRVKSSWFWLGFYSPLVFLGCGMSSDLWTIWWYLHQRSRNYARVAESDTPPVFVLWNVMDDPAHLTHWLDSQPADIQLLPCLDWDEGWNRFQSVIQSS